MFADVPAPDAAAPGAAGPAGLALAGTSAAPTRASERRADGTVTRVPRGSRVEDAVPQGSDERERDRLISRSALAERRRACPRILEVGTARRDPWWRGRLCGELSVRRRRPWVREGAGGVDPKPVRRPRAGAVVDVYRQREGADDRQRPRDAGGARARVLASGHTEGHARAGRPRVQQR